MTQLITKTFAITDDSVIFFFGAGEFFRRNPATPPFQCRAPNFHRCRSSQSISAVVVVGISVRTGVACLHAYDWVGDATRPS